VLSDVVTLDRPRITLLREQSNYQRPWYRMLMLLLLFDCLCV
jgi:hypothetical protein